MSAVRGWAVMLAVGIALAPSRALADAPGADDGPRDGSEDAPTAELPKARFSAKVAAFADYRRIYDVGMFAAEADLALGAAFRHGGAAYLDASAFGGETGGGLRARGLRFGASWESPGERLRFIGGPTYTILAIRRATSGHDMTAKMLGAFGAVAVDIARARPHSLGFQLRLDAAEAFDFFDGSAFVWGPSLGVFARY